MKRSNRLIILIGVFLAMIAFVGVVVLGGRGGGTGGGGSPSASPTTSMVQVVVAKTQITIGDKITTANVQLKTISQDQRNNYPDAFTNVQDAVAIGTIGVNLNPGDILRKSDSVPFGAVLQGQDIAAGIAQGMRAIAVDVDDINGVGTLIVPGDHVDVILSVYVPNISFDSVQSGNTKIKVDQSKDVTTKIVIQNRKVLHVLTPPPAVDTTTGQTNPNPSITPKPSDNTVRLTTGHMIVILEVKPQETEVIRWAQRAELKTDAWNYLTLGLALRSPDDYGATNPDVTQGITFRQLVTLYQVLPVDPRGWFPTDFLAKIQW